MFTALVIPVVGPIRELELAGGGRDLDTLQAAVGGLIQALPLPDFINDAANATAYMNEDGKFTCVDERGEPLVNRRATDFMVPGVGLFFGDFIAGDMVLAGFNARTGEHAELPQAVIDRARLIEREAGA